MKTTYIKQIALALSFGAMSLGANATSNTFDTVYGTNFGTGSTYITDLYGVSTTFSAIGQSGATFNYKAAQDGYQGVGVSGKTAGEIDIGESINASFTSALTISNITLGLLFNGPEYNDVNEKAKITAIFADNTSETFYLTATGETTANWSGSGSVLSLSPAINNLGGVWSISNPFGGKQVTSLSLTAATGLSAGGCSGNGVCTNQSDYTLISISAVPEPETYAMMLAGLAGIGFVARKKKQA